MQLIYFSYFLHTNCTKSTLCLCPHPRFFIFSFKSDSLGATNGRLQSDEFYIKSLHVQSTLSRALDHGNRVKDVHFSSHFRPFSIICSILNVKNARSSGTCKCNKHHQKDYPVGESVKSTATPSISGMLLTSSRILLTSFINSLRT